MRWEPDRSVAALPYTPPTSIWQAAGRGMRNRCPICGVGKVFKGYLKVVDECSNCHAPLGRLRADDAPPYFTIFVAGHILFPPVLWIEKAYQPPMWLHMVVWLPAFTIACLLLLPPIKGATVGWMMRLGFDGSEHGAEPMPRPRPSPGTPDA
ncbi:DUF983 domain-containing protein [Falsiroseomonas stagni]|uniref:Uncharacterized conserved protein, DUF983 family n=1 Tax=Falsiroseomonas stagni DSM 19981 TaxID=1123062 RepID=A0A1I3Z4P8_9PROT|nr:DUF983 domain-containing protein [Falsiroseomonas stagni]SFK38611.1 Uncharacterized conserved protein, DUF983 family [Falsiroseomonas stagni DSM 19981]